MLTGDTGQLIELLERDLNIAVIYDASDRAHARELKKHLEPLQSCATIWYSDFRAGSNPKKEVAHQIETADLIVLLFSADFKKNFGLHFATLKERRDNSAQAQKQIPVLLRSCDPPPEFDDLVWIPGTGTPLVSGDKARDEDLQRVFDELASTVAEHLGLEYTSAESAKRRLRHLSRRVPSRKVGLRPGLNSTTRLEQTRPTPRDAEPAIVPTPASAIEDGATSSTEHAPRRLMHGDTNNSVPSTSRPGDPAPSFKFECSKATIDRLGHLVLAYLPTSGPANLDELLKRAGDIIQSKVTEREAAIRSAEQAALRILQTIERRSGSYWWILFAMFLLLCLSIVVAAAILRSAIQGHT